MVRDETIKTKTLWNLFNSVSKFVPNWEQIFHNVVEQVRAHVFPNQVGIQHAVRSLTLVKRQYGRAGLINIIRFIGQTGFGTYDAEDVLFVAKAYAEGQELIVERTLAFLCQYPKLFCTVNFKHIFSGINVFGEEEIANGIKLAPSIEEVFSELEKPDQDIAERVWRIYQEDYALVTAKLGYSRVKVLYDRLRSEELSSKVVIRFLEDMTPYDGYHLTRTSKQGEAMVFGAISMVKSVGLNPKDFAEVAHNMLRAREGSRQEVLQLLKLTKMYGRSNTFLFYAAHKALECWRKPARRHVVFEAFRTGNSNILTWDFSGFSIGVAYALGDKEDRQKIDRELLGELHVNTTIATLEMLSVSHDKLLFNNHQRFAIAKLARNTLLTASILREKEPTRRIQRLAKEIFKDDAVSLFRRSKSSERSLCALALLRCWNPERLLSILDSAREKSLRAKLLLSIATYDFETTFHALEELREKDLDPSLYLLPAVSRLIHERSNQPAKGNQWDQNLISIKDEHIELLYFMQLPYQTRLAIGRSVREYRHAYAIMLRRIATGYVLR